MKFYRFGKEVRKEITIFNSVGAGITPIIRNEDPMQVGCMHYDPEAVLGMHVAPCPQLLLVVSGKGWVRVEGQDPIDVETGTAVFWEEGENHESGSDSGMTAIIIESGSLDPGRLLKE
ncbi:cupin domain-containing protein [Bacillus sp. T33-2]|uniref:cupin domain-containing protein n=1 Tax=Bacillus sp. T33-2 TaxID=2054168 RepID=UPI000C757FCA|nr:cupin [Bacillus sp. T33-2]PLR99222.1 cupin [Bacillus sp. T33-2]